MKPDMLGPEQKSTSQEQSQEKEYSQKERNEIVTMVHKKFEEYFHKIRETLNVEDRRKLGNVLSLWSGLYNSWAPGVIRKDIKKSANKVFENNFGLGFGIGEKKDIPENKKELLEKMKRILNETLDSQLG